MIGLNILILVKRGCFQAWSLKIHFQFRHLFYFVINSFEVLVYKWLGGLLGFLKERVGEYKIHICTLGSDTGNETLGKGQIFYQMLTRI